MSSTTLSTNGGTSASSLPLYSQFPISSHWELTVSNEETIKGEVYCTDPVAGIVVLHDTVSQHLQMVSISSIKGSKLVKEASTADNKTNNGGGTSTTEIDASSFNTSYAKKTLDEREKRSLKLAQESLKSVNPKASPKGQLSFDRLLKACGDAVWKGESIIVGTAGHRVIVDPPYSADNSKALDPSGKRTLDRVQKILASIGAS